jgi:hypothetical protein
MTDLRTLLDDAAGPEPMLTDTQLAEAITRGRRSRRRRRTAGTVTAVTMTVAVAGTAWSVWPSAGTAGSDAPVAGAPAAAEATGMTCAGLATKYGIVLRKADSAGKPMTPHLALPGAFGKKQFLNHTSQDRATWVFVTFSVPGSSRPAPEAGIDVPAPGPHGWTDKVWQVVATTCYPAG